LRVHPLRHDALKSSYAAALDHENRKTPISKPAANAQRPNVQAEITRTRLRKSSCGISSDRSVIAAALLGWSLVAILAKTKQIVRRCERPEETAPALRGAAGSNCRGRFLWTGRRSRHGFKLNTNASAVCPAPDTIAGDRAPVASRRMRAFPEGDLLRGGRHDTGHCTSGQLSLTWFPSLNWPGTECLLGTSAARLTAPVSQTGAVPF
jgi:hypothetical protein